MRKILWALATVAALSIGWLILCQVARAQTFGTPNQVGLSGEYPIGATPITASAVGTTASITATLSASTTGRTWICGFSIRSNATAAATGTAVITGMVTTNMSFVQWTAPLASGIGLVEEVFSNCIPSSGNNTAIAIISAAPGTGGSITVSAWGFQL